MLCDSHKGKKNQAEHRVGPAEPQPTHGKGGQEWLFCLLCIHVEWPGVAFLQYATLPSPTVPQAGRPTHLNLRRLSNTGAEVGQGEVGCWEPFAPFWVNKDPRSRHSFDSSNCIRPSDVILAPSTLLVFDHLVALHKVENDTLSNEASWLLTSSVSFLDVSIKQPE